MKLKRFITILLSTALICGFSLSISFAEDPAISYAVTDGVRSYNAHYPYTNGKYGSPAYSHLTWENGNLVRVEYSGGRIIAETYDNSFNVKNLTEIESEGSYGGFYSGSDAYYLVFGYPNQNENNDVEVFRFVKYDKNWNRIGACSVYGANTTEPFAFGGLEMAEHNGFLYVHTCHRMYKSPRDGLNHQANCTFKVQESDMTLISALYDVQSLSSGYVSHSFQQRVALDDDYLYRADLGDAYPRAITLTATNHEYGVSYPSMCHYMMTIPGETGENYTGFALGGIGLSDDYAVVAGCGITEDNPTRNIFISSIQKMDWDNTYSEDVNETAIWITDYDDDSLIDVGTPKIVKLDSGKFLLMWEEWNKYDELYLTKAVLLGHDGSPESDICTFPIALSDCEPVVDGDGCVIWYYTLNGSPKFFRLDPLRLAEAEKQFAGMHELGLCEVSLGYDTYDYNGTAITPSVFVSHNGISLKEGTDFSVEYRNNIEPGTAYVTVTGKGEYTGTAELPFRINKREQHIEQSLELGKVALGGTREISASAEGKITFKSSNEAVATVDSDGTIHGISEGEAEIDIYASETDHYESAFSFVNITVEKNEKKMEQCEIHLDLDYYDSFYTGEEIRPEIKVVSFGDTLTEGKDYTLLFKDDINAGQASVTIKGTGEYSGEVTEEYTIRKASNEIEYNKTVDAMEPGATFELNAYTKDNAKITYESDDPSVITVDENGKVTAVGEGWSHIYIIAEETDNHDETCYWAVFTISKDAHTMEDIDVRYANGKDNIATITRKCTFCGTEEKQQFSTITDIDYVFYWPEDSDTGYSNISSYACPGDEYQVTCWSSPEDAEDRTMVIESSDNSVMTVEGNTIKFVGLGNVTMTMYAKYNPSVKMTKEFTVEAERREDPFDPGSENDDPWYDPDDPGDDPDDPWYVPDDEYIADGTVVEINGSMYTVLDGWFQTVALTKAKNRKSFTVPSSVEIDGYGTFDVVQINAKAFTGKSIRTVTISSNVIKISKNAFKSSKATTMIVKSTLLKKSKVKGSLKGSKIRTIKVKVGTKKMNKAFVKTYKKYFTKKNAGRKVSVK